MVPFKDGYAGVFRCDNRAVQMTIFAGFSKDGIHWEIEHEPIKFKAGKMCIRDSFYQVEPDADGLVSYWKFDEGAGTAIPDYSGNENNATAVESLTWTCLLYTSWFGSCQRCHCHYYKER